MKNRKNVLMALNNYNIIEFIVEVDEDLQYERHLSTRVFNMLGLRLLILDLIFDDNIPVSDAKENMIDLNSHYVLYVDSLYADKGFLKAKISNKKKASPTDLYDIIPKEMVNSLLLSVGEENLWLFLRNAGFRIFYINPKEETLKNLEEIIEESENIKSTLIEMYHKSDE